MFTNTAQMRDKPEVKVQVGLVQDGQPNASNEGQVWQDWSQRHPDRTGHLVAVAAVTTCPVGSDNWCRLSQYRK